MKNDIISYNENGLSHGYCEWYNGDTLLFMGYFYNGKKIGYCDEYNYNNGELHTKIYYIR